MNKERCQRFVEPQFHVRDSVSIDDLNLKLKDMAKVVNEIGYRANVITTKRYEQLTSAS